MPTAGWIIDYVEERRAQAIHRLQATAIARIPSPPLARLRCPYCNRTFAPSEGTALEQHIAFEHPIQPPVLVLGGRVMPSPYVVRSTLRAADLAVANATSARLRDPDGRWSDHRPADLPAAMASVGEGTMTVALENVRDGRVRSQQTWTVKVAVAREEDLATVDEAFVDILARPDVSMADVNRFARATSAAASATDYASALGCYAIGVIVKDQNPARGATQRYEEHRAKYQAALDVLAGFPQRVVARAVAACVRINLNDVQSPPPASGIWHVDRSLEWLHGLATGQPVPPPSAEPQGAEYALCPIDEQLEDFLVLYVKAREQGSLEAAKEAALRTSARQITPDDRARYALLAADSVIRAGHLHQADDLLRQLTQHIAFGQWAQATRNRLST